MRSIEPRHMHVMSCTHNVKTSLNTAQLQQTHGASVGLEAITVIEEVNSTERESGLPSRHHHYQPWKNHNHV